MIKVLETERLSLRQFAVDDAPFILELVNEPAYLRFIGDKGVRTADDARAYLLEGPLASYAQNGFGLYLAELTAHQAPIGVCGLLKRDFLPDVDLGYAFLQRYWSLGYALEAAAAVIAHARDSLGLARVAAVTAPDNAGSIRLLHKLGFVYERQVLWPGDGSENKYFALDLQPARGRPSAL